MQAKQQQQKTKNKKTKTVRKNRLAQVEVLEYLEYSVRKRELWAHRGLSKYLSKMISLGQLIAETARWSGLLGL